MKNRKEGILERDKTKGKVITLKQKEQQSAYDRMKWMFKIGKC